MEKQQKVKEILIISIQGIQKQNKRAGLQTLDVFRRPFHTQNKLHRKHNLSDFSKF